MDRNYDKPAKLDANHPCYVMTKYLKTPQAIFDFARSVAFTHRGQPELDANLMRLCDNEKCVSPSHLYWG